MWHRLAGSGSRNLARWASSCTRLTTMTSFPEGDDRPVASYPALPLTDVAEIISAHLHDLAHHIDTCNVALHFLESHVDDAGRAVVDDLDKSLSSISDSVQQLGSLTTVLSYRHQSPVEVSAYECWREAVSIVETTLKRFRITTDWHGSYRYKIVAHPVFAIRAFVNGILDSLYTLIDSRLPIGDRRIVADVESDEVQSILRVTIRPSTARILDQDERLTLADAFLRSFGGQLELVEYHGQPAVQFIFPAPGQVA